MSKWEWVNESAYNYGIQTEGNITFLNMEKAEESSLAFNDGMFYLFNESVPKHIVFNTRPNTNNSELGDIRLTKVDKNTSTNGTFQIATKDTDAVFFRFGFFSFIRLNFKDLVSKYDIGKWYRIDFIIDWEGQKVSL